MILLADALSASSSVALPVAAVASFVTAILLGSLARNLKAIDDKQKECDEVNKAQQGQIAEQKTATALLAQRVEHIEKQQEAASRRAS